jgi:uncharacterized Tic20 family protein
VDRSQAERTWAVLAHLCGCLWILGIPFAATIASAVIYITKRHLSPFVAEQSREAQNFQNTVALAVIVISGLTGAFVATHATRGGAEPALAAIALGALVLAVVMLLNVALSVAAAIAAYGGVAYRYPVCVRIVR